MKNVFFTAIALVAFSGVSMANDIADIEVVIADSNEVVIVENANIVLEKVEIVAADMDCNKAKQGAIQEAKSRGMSDEDAKTAGYKIYFWCMGENAKQMQFNTSLQG